MKIPFGFCHCGCGEKTKIAKKTISAYGVIKGQPIRFIKNHHTKIGFWETVKKGAPNECWPWMGAVTAVGYGVHRFQGKQQRTHRIAFALAHNVPMPPSTVIIRHQCDNRPCCNPAHLVAGTNADNSRDMVTRDRQAKGSKNGRAKVNEWLVEQIRERHTLGESEVKLAKSFGLNKATVHEIVARKIWRHVA